MIKTKCITVLVLIGILLLSVSLKSTVVKTSDKYLSGFSDNEIVNSAPSIQMYFYIKKYAAEFNIPEVILFASTLEIFSLVN